MCNHSEHTTITCVAKSALFLMYYVILNILQAWVLCLTCRPEGAYISSKTFDTVPHQRLLKKLEHYGIRNDILNWIKAWLTDQTQCMLLKGESSPSVIVISGVPLVTVLGPLMFLLYINNISRNIASSLRLFADDCLLYRIIDSHDDITILQGDLNRLSELATPIKCI